MEVVREIENYTKREFPVYLALGNFDGVHLGHKKLISDLVNSADRGGGLAAAFIFEPHPAQILFPQHAPKLLLTADTKASLLEGLGLDILIYNSFTPAISRWSPEEFIKRVLLAAIGVKEVFVGFNHSFGHKGAGTPEYLAEMGDEWGFKVNIIPPVKYRGQVVSSSLIRQALETGDINLAQRMLGYYPIVEGEVIKGESRGATIGFPTANLGVNTEFIIPGKGVYAAWAVIDDKIYKVVVNIGSKPTFHDNYPVSIEAHIIDFNRQIYGRKLRLQFIEKLREEQRFNSIQELVAQIARDRDQARNLLVKPGIPCSLLF